MTIPVTTLRKHIMGCINNDDLLAVEMVDRYLDLLTLYRRMRRKIDQEGISTKVENGEQKYVKSHPHIADVKNINAQMVSLKRDIDKHIEEYATQQERMNKNRPKGGLLD
ncbi:terminase [Macrococcus hajekii]|uniref:Terminase n=1 Tax=Macrococcus hajekii TaxID=198482 RepID=A0A4R6BNT7_9STAP|nr:P27 family phage terminase small subunit [Macrococcus hajekii]TDM03543.1 terminase [Macrococcus hajekii]GGA99706.1 hypothetical protein GCM10007190_04700 [Macrococcus hajekii]